MEEKLLTPDQAKVYKESKKRKQVLLDAFDKITRVVSDWLIPTKHEWREGRWEYDRKRDGDFIYESWFFDPLGSKKYRGIVVRFNKEVSDSIEVTRLEPGMSEKDYVPGDRLFNFEYAMGYILPTISYDKIPYDESDLVPSNSIDDEYFAITDLFELWTRLRALFEDETGGVKVETKSSNIVSDVFDASQKIIDDMEYEDQIEEDLEFMENMDDPILKPVFVFNPDEIPIGSIVTIHAMKDLRDFQTENDLLFKEGYDYQGIVRQHVITDKVNQTVGMIIVSIKTMTGFVKEVDIPVKGVVDKDVIITVNSFNNQY